MNELSSAGEGCADESEPEAMEVVDHAVARLRGDGVTADGVHYLANCFSATSASPSRPRNGAPTSSSSAPSAGGWHGCAARACGNGSRG